MKRLLYGLAALGLLVGVAGYVQGQQQGQVQVISLTFFDPPPGAKEFQMNGSNDSGIVVGSAKYDDGTTGGFILNTNNSNYTNYVVPGSIYTALFGINNSNLMTGLKGDAALNYIPFVTDGSTVTPLNSPAGALLSVPAAINDLNQEVGYDIDSSSFSAQPVMWNADGSPVTFNAPMYPQIIFTTINNAGDIGGFGITPAGAKNGLILRNGEFITGNFGFADGTSFEILAMNDAGLWVGAYDDANGVSHSVLNLRNSDASFLNITLDAGLTSASARGITNYRIDNTFDVFVVGLDPITGKVTVCKETLYITP